MELLLIISIRDSSISLESIIPLEIKINKYFLKFKKLRVLQKFKKKKIYT